MAENGKPESRRLISLADVEKRVNRSRWWIRDEVLAGRFPKPLQHGRYTRFVEDEVDAYINNLIAARDGRAA